MKNLDIFYDLNDEELAMCMDLVPEFFNSSTVGPVAIVRDFEDEFKEDMITGIGFVVKSKPFKKKLTDREGNIMTKGTKEMDGIHSPRFGTDWLDDNAFADRYSCNCGHYIGKIFKGRRCPECGTKVKFVDVNLKITAWMKINEPAFSIIQPLMYKKIDNYLGKINKQSVLASIIDFKMEMKLDGYYEKPEGVDLNKNPFYGIGMIEFHRRFDEIMEFFSKKLKNKKFQYDHIMENRKKIFVTKIPIYSAILRDVFFTNEEWSYTKIDRQFNALYSNVSKLNEEKHISNQNIAKLNKNLFRAQSNLNKAWDLIFVSLHENEGLRLIRPAC